MRENLPLSKLGILSPIYLFLSCPGLFPCLSPALSRAHRSLWCGLEGAGYRRGLHRWPQTLWSDCSVGAGGEGRLLEGPTTHVATELAASTPLPPQFSSSFTKLPTSLLWPAFQRAYFLPVPTLHNLDCSLGKPQGNRQMAASALFTALKFTQGT